MKYDGIVIGGGPAGMLAAITAANKGLSVLLIEKNNTVGKKLLITGKGRCNITNNCTVQEILQNIPRNNKFLYSSVFSFPPEKVIAFFEENGCATKTERGNRVFPVSDKSITVLDALQKAMRNAGVEIIKDRVTEISTEHNKVSGVLCGQRRFNCKWVILATGGVSYPATGSTGDGYEMVKKLGHSITEVEGSLVPLESDDDCPRMQGLSLRNIAVKLLDCNDKVLYRDFGELLFTHFGVSGPVVLSASAHLKGEHCKLLIDLKPALDDVKLNERVLRDLDKYQNRSMENALVELLPRSMIPVVLDRLEISPELQANSLRKEKRKELVRLLKNFPIQIKCKRPVQEAIVTSGGIKTTEINPKTMESRLVSGLYFAGEIIDCDAYTGGFNLQIAWSTGFVAGSSVENFD